MAKRLTRAARSNDGDEVKTYTPKQKQEALDRLVEDYREERAAKLRHAQKNAKYRASLKEASKVRGEETTELVRALKAKDLSPADIQRTEAQFHTILRDMKVPLFDYAKIVLPKDAARANGKSKASAKAIKDAERAGEVAGSTGKDRDSSGYGPGTPEREAFTRGWDRSQASIVNKMGKSEAEPAHA